MAHRFCCACVDGMREGTALHPKEKKEQEQWKVALLHGDGKSPLNSGSGGGGGGGHRSPLPGRRRPAQRRSRNRSRRRESPTRSSGRLTASSSIIGLMQGSLSS